MPMTNEKGQWIILKEPLKIPSFKTSDGKVFEKEDEAKDHQKRIDLKSWYEDHMLFSSFGSPSASVDFDDLVEWLTQPSSKNFIREIMKL